MVIIDGFLIEWDVFLESKNVRYRGEVEIE